MTIENSELNNSGALRNSNASLTGGTGDGNRLLVADLARGFTQLPDPEKVPAWLPQNDDSGTNYVGDPLDRDGFNSRPQGWQR